MKCIYCKGDMVIIKVYKTDRCEPREKDWGCPNCRAVCNDNEAYGCSWEEGEISGDFDE